MISGYNPWFNDELVRRITEDRVERMTEIATGICEDHAAYRYACGYLDGLNRALEISDDIKKDVDAG